MNGPALSAIRELCALPSNTDKASAPVFELIGTQLDASIGRRELDRLFMVTPNQLIVAISDVAWGDIVIFAVYDEIDICSAAGSASTTVTATLADCAEAGVDAELPDVISVLWANWSRGARKIIRAGRAVCNGAPRLPVGALFLCGSALQKLVVEISDSGSVPVMAIALNSIGSTRRRPKCGVSAMALPFPGWACASGAVAGNA